MVARKWTPERWLLTAAGICLAACLLRNLGVVTPVFPRVWDKAYNGAEYLSIAIVVLRAARTSGTERAAWTSSRSRWRPRSIASGAGAGPSTAIFSWFGAARPILRAVSLASAWCSEEMMIAASRPNGGMPASRLASVSAA